LRFGGDDDDDDVILFMWQCVAVVKKVFRKWESADGQ
jgi:hypothetical protein